MQKVRGCYRIYLDTRPQNMLVRCCAVDGGHEYLRRSAPSLDDFIDLSVVKLDESTDKLFFS